MTVKINDLAAAIDQPVELVQTWNDVTRWIWDALHAWREREPKVKLFTKDLEINCQLDEGNVYLIRVDLINKRYLEMVITIPAVPDFQATISHPDLLGQEGIVKVLLHIFHYAENVKP